MRILNPNTGQEFIPINKHHSYVSAMDTRWKLFLKEVKIGPGQHTWEWISLRTDRCVDLSGINDKYCSFDNAINRAVNNPYITVYEFSDHEEMIKEWDNIKYVDSITTIYKSEEG